MQLIPYLLTQIIIVSLPLGSELPDFPGHFCTGQDKEINGYYNVSTNTLAVCDSPKGANEQIHKYTLYHEVGHFVHFNKITKKEWELYQKEWKKSVDMGSDLFIREYSMTNAMEGFADDFMYLFDRRYDTYLPAKKRVQRDRRLNIVRKITKRLEKEANFKNN